jgi:hypothetical protein
MEWPNLRLYLDQPEKLKQEVDLLRKLDNLPDEISGFIELYDHFQGDTFKITHYLSTSQKYIQQPRPKKTYNSEWKKIAAVCLMACLTIVGYKLFRPAPTFSHHTQTTENEFLIEPGIPLFLSKQPKIPWQRVMFPYKKGAFMKALNELDKLEKLNQQNDTIFYFKGILNDRLHHIAEAKYYFTRTCEVNSVFVNRAQFYLAIIDWKSGDKHKAYKKIIELKHCNDPSVQQAVYAFLKAYSLRRKNH